MKTIRMRIAFWIVGLVLVILSVFGAIVYWQMDSSLRGAIDDSLLLGTAQTLAALDVAQGQVVFTGHIPELPDLKERKLTIRVLDADGHIRQAVGTYSDLPIDQASVTMARAGEPVFTTQLTQKHENPIRFRTAPLIQQGRVVAIVQVAQSLDQVMDTLEQLNTALLISVPLLIILAGAGGYLLASHALKPIDTITRTANRISAEDLHARLNLPVTNDEVGRLASTFDAMLGRLDASFQRERRFTADASHELRTPLATMQAILGVMRSQRRTPEDYEGALDDLVTQTDRLRGLVESLLQLARSDAQPITSRKTVDLSTVVEDVVETVRPLAEEKGLVVRCEIAPALMIPGDRDNLIRLFLNLLDNAIKYTTQGEIAVSAMIAGKTIEVRVHDTGIGISDTHVPYIFDRFYQVDAARSTRGNGLGLAIAQEIAHIHGGSITVTSTSGAGSLFCVRFPYSVNNKY